MVDVYWCGVARGESVGDCTEVVVGMKTYVYYVSYSTGQSLGCCTSSFTSKINDWSIDDFKAYNARLAKDLEYGQVIALNFIFLREEDVKAEV